MYPLEPRSEVCKSHTFAYAGAFCSTCFVGILKCLKGFLGQIARRWDCHSSVLMLTNSCIKVVDDVDFDCLTVLGFCMPHIRHHVSCLKMFFLFLGTAPKFYNPHNWYSTFSVFG